MNTEELQIAIQNVERRFDAILSHGRRKPLHDVMDAARLVANPNIKAAVRRYDQTYQGINHSDEWWESYWNSTDPDVVVVRDEEVKAMTAAVAAALTPGTTE